jgi:hypothetical protein
MKKVFAGLVILLSAVLCLSGCEDNKIDDGLEKQVTEKGKEMMQAWVDENMPGAELENCKAYIDYAPGPGRYLTDYASGRDFRFRYTGRSSLTIYAYVEDGWLYCDIYEG